MYSGYRTRTGRGNRFEPDGRNLPVSFILGSRRRAEMDDILRMAQGILRATPQRWMTLAELHPDLFRRRPAPKEWSAFDCLQHLVDTERGVFPPRIGCLLRGEDFPDFDPDRQGTARSADARATELAREFGRLRWENLALLSRLVPADLDRKARHAELGKVTMGELIHEWAGH